MGNMKNCVIAVLSPLPSIVFYLTFLQNHTNIDTKTSSCYSLWKWCSKHPLLLANLLFTFNVDLLFWILGIIQSSHWMIDLYWTVIPVMLSHYYATHPFSYFNPWRSAVVISLTWVWSIRLTYSYFRREKWEWGAREDWRFDDMRKQYGKHWWWVSFFAVYASQQIFLMGITLPVYAVHSVEKPWNIYDSVATTICMFGIIFAYFADTQLHEFVSSNEKRKELGVPKLLTLEKGLWRYSRHPNYIGEQLWWWGLVMYGWNVGYGWTFIGSLVNSLCLAYVTILVEQRILKQADRVEAYNLYQKTTSVWIPWFKFSPRGAKDKNS